MIKRCSGSCPMKYLGEWFNHKDESESYEIFICKTCGVLYKNSVNPENRILLNLDNTIEKIL